jgi:hypothetical protein
MMFTSSDASSLVRELWWWEHAEYVFGALVAAACAGEYIADFNKRPWVKAHKDRIAKISTLVLVAALVFELICITRANGKSDEVIGKLRDEAEAADKLAQSAVQNSNTALGTSATALSQAKDAVTKSGKAADSLGKAEAEANKAQSSSSNALTLSRSAREEADSFERDIVSAKTQAAEAESHLADALQRAANAELAIAKIKQPRTLNPEQQQRVGTSLLRFAGQNFSFLVFNDPESFQLLTDINAALKIAKWNVTPSPPGLGSGFGYSSAAGTVSSVNTIGLKVYIASDDPASEPAMLAFANAVISEGIPCQALRADDLKDRVLARKIIIVVGQKQL